MRYEVHYGENSVGTFSSRGAALKCAHALGTDYDVRVWDGRTGAAIYSREGKLFSETLGRWLSPSERAQPEDQ